MVSDYQSILEHNRYHHFSLPKYKAWMWEIDAEVLPHAIFGSQSPSPACKQVTVKDREASNQIDDPCSSSLRPLSALHIPRKPIENS